MIRLLLVDDQVLFVESLRRLLEIDADDMEVVDIAHDGAQALEKTPLCRPDVILMDVRMPGMDGVAATKQIKLLFPQIHIVMLTTFDDDKYVYNALALGADGYLLKDSAPSELLAAVRAVYQGGVTVSPAVARKLAVRSSYGQDSGTDALERLSRREREVLKLIGEGCDNTDISERLFLSEQTVRNYVSLLYGKLGVERRSQAIRIAKDAGL